MCVLLHSDRNWGYGGGFKQSFLVLDLQNLFFLEISFNKNMLMCFGHLKKKKKFKRSAVGFSDVPKK